MGPSLDPGAFAGTVQRVQAYVRSEPGAWTALADSARADPVGTTRSLLALGTVLLDLAASAYDVSPDEMLTKVSRTLDLHRLADSRLADGR